MGQRENILERIARNADLHTEPIPRLPLVELSGEQRVLIENHHGVILYSGTEIRVRVSYGAVRVCGRSLRLQQMTRERLVITGCMDCIQLDRGR